MYTKGQYEKLIEGYFPALKRALNIKGKVNIHVYNSQSKKYKKLFPRSSDDRGRHEYGFAFINSDGDADVCLFYDKHSSDRGALSTLIHELLHVRMHKITGLVTIKSESMGRQEEILVSDLEKVIINSFWNQKL